MLQQIISNEKAQAINSIQVEKKTLEEYARRSLEQALKRKLAAQRQRIDKALENPLVADDRLLVIDHLGVLLPRNLPFTQSQSIDSIRIYQHLLNREYHKIDVEEDNVWATSIELYKTFFNALTAKDDAAIKLAFKQIIAHRKANTMEPLKDVPYLTALLRDFHDKGKPSNKLMSVMLREGWKENGKVVIPGLQQRLLLKRTRFTASQYNYFVNQIIDLSQAAEISYADFQSQATRPSLDIPPVTFVNQSALANKGQWYIEPHSIDRMVGLQINFARALRLVAKEMRELGLLKENDNIVLQSELTDTVFLADLKLLIQTTRWETLANEIRQRYFYKVAMIVACGVFALIMIILATAYQHRKQKLLALRSDFISAVSHELRTPLTSIRLLAETLEYRLADVPEARDYPSRIVKDIDGLSLLVENILSYNRLQKDQWELHYSNIDIKEIIASIEHELHLYTNKNVVFEYDDVDLINISADVELVKLLLFNLIRNACYYNIHEEVIIRISCDPKRKPVLRIRDNGVGIDKQYWSKVFGDFYRLQHGAKKNIRGSGLGLSICKKIMALHHGTITILESSSEGTCFELVFSRPARPEPDSSKE
jgi:signal transduction histidine kinase